MPSVHPMRFEGERVCITGATGFLGGALARALAARGAEVHALRRRSSREPAGGLPVTWHVGDVTEPGSLPGFLRGAAWIVHAAGRLGAAGVPEAAYQAANVAGTRHVLDAALEVAPRARVLHLSSAGVLGPTAAEAGEDAPLRPTNGYERSKAAGEELARGHARRGLAVVIARPGFIYGPGDRHVLKLFQAIGRRRFFLLDGGRCRCQPTYVDDAVSGMLACLASGRPGEAYHLVGPRAVSFRQLADAIAGALAVPRPALSLPRWPVLLAAGGLELAGRVTGRPPPLTMNGVRFFSQHRVVSTRKAREELGWAPLLDVADGARRTVDWYRAQGWI